MSAIKAIARIREDRLTNLQGRLRGLQLIRTTLGEVRYRVEAGQTQRLIQEIEALQHYTNVFTIEELRVAKQIKK